MADKLRTPLYAAEQSVDRIRCCVTGASGYIAAAIIQRLLAAGHTVNATVRNPNDTGKVAHLTALPGAQDRLKFFAADLTQPSSFDEAVKGCLWVFHVASPFILKVPRSEVDDKLINPAVNGVVSVLNSVAKSGDAEVVVMTSSVAAICGDHWEHGKDRIMTEDDWNASASADFLPYAYSKTLAERKAWEQFRAQHVPASHDSPGKKNYRLCTINPGFVIGPPLALMPAESVQFCKRMVKGGFKSGFPHMCFGTVDVDDVAASHVLAAINPNASGRYICVSETVDFLELMKEVGRVLEPPRRLVGSAPPYPVLWVLANVFGLMPWDQTKACLSKPPKFSNEKIKKELGIVFKRSAVASMADMAVAVEALMK